MCILTPAYCLRIWPSTRDLGVEALLKKKTTFLCFSACTRIAVIMGWAHTRRQVEREDRLFRWLFL